MILTIDSTNKENIRNMAEKPYITADQAATAIQTILTEANNPFVKQIAIAIVDDAGLMVAYYQMDNVRLYARRHAFRKAYTAAIMGMDTSVNGDQLKERGRTVSDYGDPNLTPGEGGVVVLSKSGIIMGGIGVGGYIERDEELAALGLKSMNIA